MVYMIEFSGSGAGVRSIATTETAREACELVDGLTGAGEVIQSIRSPMGNLLTLYELQRHAKQEEPTGETAARMTPDEFEAIAWTAEEQARHLTALNRHAIESGIEVTDDQVIKLQRHQAALAELIQTLTNHRFRKA